MNIWHLWSKTRRQAPSDWHALPWHLIEVGVVAEQIWRYRVASSLKDRFAERLGVDEHDLLTRWVGFITAIHDLGKISPKFQGLVPAQAARLLDLGIATVSAAPSLKHGLVSASELPAILGELFGMEMAVAERYAYLTAGHHGVMWSARSLRSARSSRRLVGRAEWEWARREAVSLLAESFDIPAVLPGRLATERLTYEDAIFLAGLITAADWLGSDERHFTYCTRSASATEARKEALARANRAMGATGWYQQPVFVPSATFGAAIRSLPKDAEPYPAQRVAVEAISATQGPGISIVEYPMGWGKTEIALWAAARWAEAFDMPGFYIAMPTMATSDQLHQRVTRHLSAHLDSDRSPVNLELLHGQAELSAMPEIPDHGDLFTDMEQALADVKDLEDGVPGQIRRTSWFTRRKRGLLATYGVGTVDQVLMSVLQTRHFFVRTHGLGGKSVIFDEVHSYDVYMSRLFDAVLRWLGALGSPVVILSATLPAARTRQMIDAYREGAGWDEAPLELAPYPRITVADGRTTHSHHGPPPAHELSRNVVLHMIPTAVDDEAIWETVGPRLDAALSGGGTAAVICNTVRQAQRAYRALQCWFPSEQLTLFHARFRQLERRTIQEQVLDGFGKDVLREETDTERPDRHVVVATQVIEQSLDLDFDLMISMFCPTDLLLQRIGRMQRHPALDPLRPNRFRGRPELWLVGVTENDGLPVFPSGTRRVYAPHVLIRSWAALQGKDAIAIPDDVEALIETTYGEDTRIPTPLEALWRESETVWKAERQADAETAKAVAIPSLIAGNDPGNRDVLTRITSIREDQEDEPLLHASAVAQTRLGDPTLSLVVLTRDEAGRFADAIETAGDEPLPLKQIRPLLLRAVNVSLPQVVHAAVGMEAPTAWAATSHLRHHRLVVLDDSNRGAVGVIPIELHPTLGVLFGNDIEKGT